MWLQQDARPVRLRRDAGLMMPQAAPQGQRAVRFRSPAAASAFSRSYRRWPQRDPRLDSPGRQADLTWARPASFAALPLVSPPRASAVWVPPAAALSRRAMALPPQRPCPQGEPAWRAAVPPRGRCH